MRQGTRFLSSILVVTGIGAFWASSAEADVVLNEVNCEGTDWVEVVNTSGDPADISGWLLTDAPVAEDDPGHRMLFADPTVIPPDEDLVVERTTDFPFGISCGDTIRLADASETVEDEAALGPRPVSTDTWGRYPNGSGPFGPTVPTRGAPNEPSSGGGGPGPDLSAWLFDPANVVEIDLELPPESIAELEEAPTEYQDAVFSLTTSGASYGPLAVGARLKGGLGSFRPLSGKAAFKLKFNHSAPGQRFVGLKGLTLNNMVQDPSMIHETLAYETFRAAGVAAPRTGYAYVRVNDQDYGLYLNVETVDEVFLSRWFASTQHLYEGEYGSDVVPGAAGSFEVDEGPEADRSDLEELIDAAAPLDGGWSAQVGSVFDLDQATRMWAIERYVGHWDSYSGEVVSELHPNNYYLHSDAEGRFRMLPWGTDITWAARMYFDGPGGGVLFRRCLEDLQCLQLYRDALGRLRTILSGLDLDGMAASTAAMLGPWQALDPRREYSLAQIATAVEEARNFIAVRPFDIDYFLAGGVAEKTEYTRGAPDTEITERPMAKTKGRRVRFGFRSTDAVPAFECKLDRGAFTRCNSPLRWKVGPGRHRFLTRAVSAAGLVDPTAAEARFEVLPRRRGRGGAGASR